MVPPQMLGAARAAAQTLPGDSFALGPVIAQLQHGPTQQAQRDALTQCSPLPPGLLDSLDIALAAPNDPAYHELIGDLHLQWPAHSLDALAAWAYYPGRYFDAATRPQDGPVVALIDTGVDAAHPDFINPGASSADVHDGGQLLLGIARTFIGGDPEDETADVTDEHGHGTHLAGLIGAATDNGTTAGSGIAGIGYPVRLLPLKVAEANGAATHADIARAITHAANQGCSIILTGFSGPTWSQALQDAVDYAWHRGCFIVAPAGDTGAAEPVFPAACPHVFGVAATTASGSRADYSSRGGHVAVAAPGGDEAAGIYSTLPTYACALRQDLSGNPYGYAFGTSQAAAHVAAGAALYAGMNDVRPSTGREGTEIWQALQRSAAAGEAAPAGWDPGRGYGALSLPALLAGAAPMGDGLGSIVGRVLLRGSPALGASVAAAPQEGGAAISVTAQWPAGAYRIANLPPGSYRVTAQSEDSCAEREAVTVLEGADAPGVDFRLSDPPADAMLVSAQIPAAAVRGETLTLCLTFANTGESTWRRADGYCLAQAACQAPIDPVLNRVELLPGEAIAPGHEHSFLLSLSVPDGFGFYETAWQMCQEGGAGRFGDAARATVSVSSFLDVPADHWAVCEIEAAKQADIVRGYGDHLFRPASPVARDQMAVYIARALAEGDEAVPPGPNEPTFVDVGLDHWAWRYIEYAHECEIVQGYEDGSYHPGDLLDRAQMSVFIARALAGGESGLSEYVPPEAPTFADVPTDSWAYRSVEYLAGAGVVSGYPDDLYHPNRPCSRDQMAVYITRAFNLDC